MISKSFFLTTIFILSALTPSGKSYVAETFTFDHSIYSHVLKAYAAHGKVDYTSLKANRKELDSYVQLLGKFSKNDYENMSRNEKIAFWLNAYNAITIKVIIDYYPLRRSGPLGFRYPSSSIRQISGVWDEIKHEVLGKERTLGEIEHEILRKEFKDPRVHFALVCASIGCPVLRSEPYFDARLDDQLDDQIRQFLSAPEKFKYDRVRDVLYLSPIFKWFKIDFKQAGGMILFIKNYLPQNVSSELSSRTKIEWLDYDWSLNEKESNT